jgi:16S rRNA G966 N2-methylase RsmD
MIDLLIRKEVQDFILAHEQEDEKKLVLKHRMILEVPSSIIAEQIVGRRKAKSKLPLYYNTPNIVYPPGLNLEQSSSEKTAELKATSLNFILGPNKIIADLTGGFGVDSFFMSRVCKEVIYAEPNDSLLQFAKHNHATLGATNIQHHNTTAENFLSSFSGKVDCIFIDPSRRNKASQKVFKLSDCEPDVPGLLSEIFQRSNCLLIKTSPLLDLQQGIKELKSVEKVWVVSVDNECKELLFFCRKDFVGEPRLVAVNLQEGHENFEFSLAEEKNTISKFSGPLSYLYEPNASILKAGAFKMIGEKYSLFKAHPSTHLYTSTDLIQNFPGRIFKIICAVKPDPKVLHEILPDGKANVITRNYPLTPQELKKKTKLKDGGEGYLLGFTGPSEKYLVAAERIK